MGFQFYGLNKLETTGNFSVYDLTGGSYTLTSETFTDGSFLPLIDKDKYNAFSISQSSAVRKLHYEFSTSAIINAIAFQNNNLRNWQVNINSTTITLDTDYIYLNDAGAQMVTASFTQWSDNNTILIFSSITCATIEVFIFSSTSGDPYIGQMIPCELIYELPNNPNFSKYKPILKDKIEKTTIDGGSLTYRIKEKFSGKISLNYVPASVTSNLYSLYNTSTSYHFCPFPTGTSWDGDIWPVNWTGNYLFKENNVNNRRLPYYKGSLILKEIPT